jgi:uncharacterized membrane protein
LPFIETLAEAVKPWADFYSKSKPASLGITYVHIASVVVGGGLAIACDRLALRKAAGSTDDRVFMLREVAAVHRPVLVAIGVIVVSGAAMMLADVETFLKSPVYYTKMALFLVLALNGWFVTRNERQLAADPSPSNPVWGRLKFSAVASIVLWLSVALAGVLLTSS